MDLRRAPAGNLRERQLEPYHQGELFRDALPVASHANHVQVIPGELAARRDVLLHVRGEPCIGRLRAELADAGALGVARLGLATPDLASNQGLSERQPHAASSPVRLAKIQKRKQKQETTETSKEEDEEEEKDEEDEKKDEEEEDEEEEDRKRRG